MIRRRLLDAASGSSRFHGCRRPGQGAPAVTSPVDAYPLGYDQGVSASKDRGSQNTFISEAMSPQRRASWRERLSKLSRLELIEIETQIAKLLKEGRFDADVEIASKHCDPNRVHRTIKDQGRRKLQEIYCAEEPCPKCPHGPFWFVFRSSRLHGTRIRFQSAPALPPDLIEKMENDIRPPIAWFEIKTDVPST